LRLPRVAPDVLTLGAGNVSGLANSVRAAAISSNGTAADESGIMSRAFDSYRTVLNGEVYMFSVIMIFKSRRNASPGPAAEREMCEQSAP